MISTAFQYVNELVGNGQSFKLLQVIARKMVFYNLFGKFSNLAVFPKRTMFNFKTPVSV
jgi:hypothetical protein